MASLSSIPQELRLSIGWFLSAEDLYHLGRCCKAYWTTFESLMEKKRDFTIIRLFEHWRDENYHHIHRVFRQLIENPSLLPFVEALFCSVEARFEPEKLTDDDCILFAERICKASFLNAPYNVDSAAELAEHKGRLKRASREHDHGVFLTYFIGLFPNLTELDYLMHSNEEARSWQLSTLKRILSAYTTPTSNLPFQNLACLKLVTSMRHARADIDIDVEWILYSMRIPSLRSLQVTCSRDRLRRSDSKFDLDLPISKITDLGLDMKIVEPEAICQILDGIGSDGAGSLEHFKLLLTRDRGYDPSAIVHKLVVCASHSLKTLSLRYCNYEDISFRVSSNFKPKISYACQ